MDDRFAKGLPLTFICYDTLKGLGEQATALQSSLELLTTKELEDTIEEIELISNRINDLVNKIHSIT